MHLYLVFGILIIMNKMCIGMLVLVWVNKLHFPRQQRQEEGGNAACCQWKHLCGDVRTPLPPGRPCSCFSRFTPLLTRYLTELFMLNRCKKIPNKTSARIFRLIGFSYLQPSVPLRKAHEQAANVLPHRKTRKEWDGVYTRKYMKGKQQELSRG